MSIQESRSFDGNTIPERGRWLCIAYAFPPVSRSGSFRTLGFVRELNTMGWDATVITVEPGDEKIDLALLDQIPSKTKVVRVPWTDRIVRIKKRLLIKDRRQRNARHADECDRDTVADPHHGKTEKIDSLYQSLRDFVSRAMMIPDSRASWIGPAYRASVNAVKQLSPHVIYSTSPYASAHLIARKLSKRFRLPWVADFRDPWRANPFAPRMPGLLGWWDEHLEMQVLKDASWVVCNTPTMERELIERRPLVSQKCSTILNGIDEGVYSARTTHPSKKSDEFTITHCGNFYGPRKPDPWFEALRQVLRDCPRNQPNITLRLVGEPTYDGKHLAAIADEYGIAKNIEVYGTLEHQTALDIVADSDAVILAGSAGDGAHLQVPNKLFEYLALKRPIIAGAVKDNPAVEILKKSGAKAVLCKPDDASDIASALKRCIDGKFSDDHAAWHGVDQFSRRERARELTAIFDRLTTNRPDSKTSVIEEKSLDQEQVLGKKRSNVQSNSSTH